MNDYLAHYGTKRHSGRYPYGSGEDPYQHEDWVSRDNKLKKQGFTEIERANMLGCESTSEYRALRSKYTNEVKAGKIARVKYLVNEKGYSHQTASEMTGIPISTLKSYLEPEREARANKNIHVKDLLKEQVDSDKYVDVGKGTNINIGVSSTRLQTAIKDLEKEGYKIQYLSIPQLGTNHFTSYKILTKEDVPWQELQDNRYKVATLGGGKIVDEDGNVVSVKNQPMKSISSSRVKVRYNEDGGADKDGVIELRRGVDDISLGNANYAQVRIAVDDTHYLKGMAMYSDSMPKGVDIVFNTNKHKGTPMIGPGDDTVLKKMKEDKQNPFGATIKDEEDLLMTQRYYTDKNGKRQLSVINIVNEEGDWGRWSKTLSSQFLSKQNPALAKQQLDLDYMDRKNQLDDINKLTNPTIKKKLLESFADGCDAAAVDLKAAPLPGQKSYVLLPFTTLKDNEVYAPNYPDGTELVLVRYPHGGIFEIPKLKVVNKKHSEIKDLIGNATDAIGISKATADQLSGADFDGDTAIAIPLSDKVKINTEKPLKGLIGWDPKEAYPYHEGMAIMAEDHKQIQMGVVSNLITDMTLKGATGPELERAVKHSMVVIDAVKHKLDYQQSYKDNRITELKEKYQDGGGASTIISRAGKKIYINERKPIYGINKTNTNPETGERIYQETGKSYEQTTINRKGEEVTKTVVWKEKVPWMTTVNDASELVSSGGYRMEKVYANYANQMKALANSARKSYLETEDMKYNPSAKKTYEKEVEDLKVKLKDAEANSPKERQAILLGNKIVESKRAENPDMDKEHVKKLKGTALTAARVQVGAKKQRIEITDKEWEAIQAGAISANALKSILDNTDLDEIKRRATPRDSSTKGLSASKIALIRSMQDRYSTSEIAERIGVSPSTVSKYLNAV